MVEEFTDEKLLIESKKYWEKLHENSEYINIEDKRNFKEEILNNKENLNFDVDYFVKLFEELVERYDDPSSDINRQDVNSIGPVSNFFK